MTVTTLVQLRAFCKKNRLELDTSRPEEYCVYSPKGYHFNANDAHVCIAVHRGDKRWKLEAIQDLMRDIKEGLERCPKDCDACYG